MAGLVERAVQNGHDLVALKLTPMLFDYICSLPAKVADLPRRPRDFWEWGEKTWSHEGEVSLAGVSPDPGNELDY